MSAPAIAKVESRADQVRRERSMRLDRFPRTTVWRWIVRAFFFVLFVVPPILGASELGSVNTPNQQLLDHLATISWDRADQNWIGDIFPPLSTLLAAVASPFGRLGLSIAGAAVVGVFLQKLLEIMIQRRFPIVVGAVLLAALAFNPLFAYTATENLPAIMGLAFFALGIADVARFNSWGSTQAGFRAGLMLMLAVLSDTSALLYVGAAALCVPFLRLRREGQRGIRAANLLVVVYPTLAALGAIVALNLIFLGQPLTRSAASLLDGTDDRLLRLGEIFSQPSGWLLLASVGSAWLVALLVRRPAAIFISTLVFAAILIAFVLGLLPSGSAGNTFILMTVMAAALIPAGRSRPVNVALLVVALLQIGIAWASAFARPILQEWVAAMNAVLGLG
jgi:hypothetical protein